MSGGRHRNTRTVVRAERKGVTLSKDEWDTAVRLRASRMSWEAVARAVGRSVPDLRASLDPTWKG